MHKFVIRSVVISTCLLGSTFTEAATLVNLDKQPVSFLRQFVAPVNHAAANASGNFNVDQVKEIKRNIDQNKVTHIRVQQQHAGFPVWGADAVIHMPGAPASAHTLMTDIVNRSANSSMNGVLYQNLNADLQNAPQQIFTQTQADLAAKKALELAANTYGRGNTNPATTKLMVYVDQNNKAHWAFLVSVYMQEATRNKIPAKPVYILDALTLKAYKSWNDMRGANEIVNGGGYGGNKNNAEKLQYDGLEGHLKPLLVTRDSTSNNCLMLNSDVELHDGRGAKNIMSYRCDMPNSNFNNVFWNGSMDEINGGYSPANDALYAGSVVQQLYQQWLQVPMLKKPDGKPMVLKMFTHVGKRWENAVWDPEKEEVRLGDGADTFYPLTSLDIIAHEVSHGFTSQHSNLVYADQAGSMDEAFSDMASQAAENFSSNQNSWKIGASVSKQPNTALRYMDKPSKDCQGNNKPGNACSIDHVSQYPYLEQTSYLYTQGEGEEYRQSYIVHLASGIYNRVFYLLSTSTDWDVKKAFTVMAQANANYWTQTTDFQQGACGVLKAAADFNYDTTAVVNAFTNVGIDTRQC